jgi:hypothetical protein
MISEIKRWAKSRNYDIKNFKGGGYNWKYCSDNEWHFSKDVESVATDIFNHLTKDKWKSYQEEFLKKRLLDK